MIGDFTPHDSWIESTAAGECRVPFAAEWAKKACIRGERHAMIQAGCVEANFRGIPEYM
jgi:hypothetical protein